MLIQSFLIAHAMLVIAVMVAVASGGVWWMIASFLALHVLYAWWALLLR